MTVINVIEIDNIDYKLNDIKYAIQNNDPIEEKLHVILVISNPCLYAKRYILFKEFVKRIEEEETNVILYIVELCYGTQKFLMTSNNKRHLQLRTDTPIWHKESMINAGVKLLPKNYKAFAWIDADVEFDSSSWALDTLKILNGSKDVIQLFSQCVDMDADQSTLRIFHGFGYSFSKQKKYTLKGNDFWHPGFAWAITRKAYERVGIYDKGILGSGDNIMATSFIHKVEHFLNPQYSDDYNQSMLDYQARAKGLRLGYTPGIIRHHYHGSKKNRNYTERWKILIDHGYSPLQHITYENGLIVANMNKDFSDDILKYFQERKEDD